MSVPFADCHNDLLLGVTCQRDLGDDDLFGQFWLPQPRRQRGAGGAVLRLPRRHRSPHAAGLPLPGPGSFSDGLERPADLPAFGECLEQDFGHGVARAVASGTMVEALTGLLPDE